MRVLIFGFTPDYDNEHLPHNYKPNSIVYTSTHDSQTVCEQIMDICSEPEKQFAYRYLRTSHAEAMGWSAIKCVWASSANIAMTTLQDLLARCGFPHEHARDHRRQELALARARRGAQSDRFVHAR